MSDQNLEFKKKETYLRMIKNAKGTRLFGSMFVFDKKKGTIYDVCENGDKSCAYFVSSILAVIGLIDRPHATVETTFRQMMQAGWKEIGEDDLQRGDVIVWEKEKFSKSGLQEHIGFFLGESWCCSTSYKKKRVVFHKLGKRPVKSVLRHPLLIEKK